MLSEISVSVPTMTPPRKIQPLRPANDIAKGRRRFAAVRISLPTTYPRRAVWMGAGLLAVIGLGSVASLTVLSQRMIMEPLPAAIATTKTPPSNPQQLTDIILPASSLSAEETSASTPDQKNIDIVAGDIANLPALGGHETDTAAPVNEDVSSLIYRAHEMMTEQRWQDAVELYREALLGDPQNHSALSGLIFAAHANQDVSTAIQTSEILVAAYPDDSAAAVNLARLLQLDNRDDEAIPYLDSAVRQEPDNATYRLELATLYDRTGHADQALTLYHQLATLDDDGDTSNLPLEAVNQRISYLESATVDDDASTTLPVDN
jgi:tetratricopeptide (TPR) repeat protein